MGFDPIAIIMFYKPCPEAEAAEAGPAPAPESEPTPTARGGAAKTAVPRGVDKSVEVGGGAADASVEVAGPTGSCDDAEDAAALRRQLAVLQAERSTKKGEPLA
jgi:hypothetical protein